jgi:hypothetical protein
MSKQVILHTTIDGYCVKENFQMGTICEKCKCHEIVSCKLNVYIFLLESDSFKYK